MLHGQLQTWPLYVQSYTIFIQQYLLICYSEFPLYSFLKKRSTSSVPWTKYWWFNSKSFKRIMFVARIKIVLILFRNHFINQCHKQNKLFPYCSIKRKTCLNIFFLFQYLRTNFIFPQLSMNFKLYHEKDQSKNAFIIHWSEHNINLKNIILSGVTCKLNTWGRHERALYLAKYDGIKTENVKVVKSFNVVIKLGRITCECLIIGHIIPHLFLIHICIFSLFHWIPFLNTL